MMDSAFFVLAAKELEPYISDSIVSEVTNDENIHIAVAYGVLAGARYATQSETLHTNEVLTTHTDAVFTTICCGMVSAYGVGKMIDICLAGANGISSSIRSEPLIDAKKTCRRYQKCKTRSVIVSNILCIISCTCSGLRYGGIFFVYFYKSIKFDF